MARLFDVTSASDTVRLDTDGQGEMPFTATNVSGRPLRARAVLVAEDPASKPWFTLAGAAERSFPAAGVEQFAVKVAIPPGTKAGTYNVRLDVVSVENPDEDYSQGPTVSASVVAREPPKVVPPPPSKPFPWKIVAGAVAALVVVGVVIAWVIRSPEVDVPQIVGLSPVAARTALTKAGLRANQAGMEKSAAVAPGLVSSQNPKPTAATGRKAPSDTTVDFKVAEAPARRRIPDVVRTPGIPLNEALETLVNAGFTRFNTPTYRVVPVAAAWGKVIDQTPPANSMADPAEPVSLVVGRRAGVFDSIKWRDEVSKPVLDRVLRENPHIGK